MKRLSLLFVALVLWCGGAHAQFIGGQSTLSSAGVATGAVADETAFTAATTLTVPAGCYYQSTQTNNPLSNLQSGAVACTVNRAMQVNLRNANGTEIATSAAPLQVSLANTAANGTAVSVTCSNCVGASATDTTTFTPATSAFAASGGFFQTTATNNPLANLQQGMAQMTAQRAFFVNLRNASGTELGTSTTPLVNNTTQIGSTAIDTNSGNKSAGTQRVVLATDQPNLTTALNINNALVSGTAIDVNSGVKSAGTQRFVLATDQPNLTTALNVNQSLVAGTAVDTNSGVKSAGTQRVVLATDQPALTTPMPQNQTQVAGTAIDVNTGNASAGTTRVVLASNQPVVSVTSPITATVTNPTSTLTLVATTSAYGANTLVASSATAGSVVVPSFAIATSAGSALISRLRLRSNDATSTAWGNQTLQVDLWTTAPTFTNGDRGAWLTATGTAGHVGSFTCATSAVQGDGVFAECSANAANFALVTLASGTSVFWTLQAISGSGVTGATKAWTLTAEVIN